MLSWVGPSSSQDELNRVELKSSLVRLKSAQVRSQQVDPGRCVLGWVQVRKSQVEPKLGWIKLDPSK